jgi:hypothetical protein
MKVIRSIIKVPIIAIVCFAGLVSVAFAADSAAVEAVAVFGVPLPDFLVYASAIISAASTLAAALPQPAEGSVWWYVRKVIDWAALNVGHAKNATKA